MFDLFYLIIFIGFGLSLLVQGWLKWTYAHWSKVRNSLNAPGAHVAEAVLSRNNLQQCRLVMQPGALTDHYDPRTKTVSLSQRIYTEPSVASAAIAAHECGHAMQDGSGYGPLRLRYQLMPVAIFGARYGPWAAIGGWMLRMPLLLQLGFVSFAASLVFQLLSLPIEFDASRRAKRQLELIGLTAQQDVVGAKKVLRAAAMTYVAGSATAMGHLVLLLAIAGRSFLRRLILLPK